MSQYVESYSNEYVWNIKDEINHYLKTHLNRKLTHVSMCEKSVELRAIVVYEDK